MMKTKLLTICLLLISSQVFASDDLSGKKLFCTNEKMQKELHNLETGVDKIRKNYTPEIITYSFLDHKRFERNNFSVWDDPYIVKSKGTYSTTILDIILKLDIGYVVNKESKGWIDEYESDGNKWQLSEWVDRQKLTMGIMPCILFNGTREELWESANIKFFNFIGEFNQREKLRQEKLDEIREEVKRLRNKRQKEKNKKDEIQRKKNKI